jgi:hypothetical protein
MPGSLRLTRDFYFKLGLYYGGQHAAVDLTRRDAATFGSPVVAVADGTLVANPLDHLSGYNVLVQHADGWRSGYRHFRELIFPPNVGITVRQGQVIGYADTTGTASGPHLHFDLWNRQRLSPEAFFKLGFWAHDPMKWLAIDEPEAPEEGDIEMFLIRDDRGVVYVVDALGKRNIDDQAELDIYRAVLGPWRQVNDHTADSIPDTNRVVTNIQDTHNVFFNEPEEGKARWVIWDDQLAKIE